MAEVDVYPDPPELSFSFWGWDIQRMMRVELGFQMKPLPQYCSAWTDFPVPCLISIAVFHFLLPLCRQKMVQHLVHDVVLTVLCLAINPLHQ